MATGTVKWFNTARGYGFIQPDDGGKDIFVHISAVERAGMTTLSDGQKISFELESGRDGRMAAGNLATMGDGGAEEAPAAPKTEEGEGEGEG